MNLTEEEQKDLKTVLDFFEDEDRATRDRQLRSWRRLKLLWDGFSRTWYSEVAHDWRVWDEQQVNDANQQDYYNKPINVFRAYLESIIAALSVSIPSVRCYPDDADNPLDLLTAKAGDKISELISSHNNVSLLWLHALYIYCTEGMVSCYTYTKEDDSFGTYEQKNHEDTEELHEMSMCPQCGTQIDETVVDAEKDEFDPNNEDSVAQYKLMKGQEMCPQCLADVDPEFNRSKVIVTRLVGTTTKAKARQCMEVYGGLYVKVANYAKCQADTPYLGFCYETSYTFAREWYPKLRDKIQPGMSNPSEPYARWGRTNPQYQGELPLNNVTVRNYWFRSAAFEVLDEDKCDKFKKKFPNGCKVVFIEQEFAEAVNESLDDHWTLTTNPLSDFIYFDPIGLLLTSIQEITNDLVSLTLQTIEHGIPQTFADSGVINLKAYSQMETVPGAIYAATPKTGKSMGDAFHEVKTATLSAEVLPFGSQIQEYGQLVSGAQPSLFGGQVGGSGTASEYSMQRAQSLQRLQTTWKMFNVWWKQIYGKVIPAYIKTVQDDQRTVKKDEFGGFVNELIRKADLEGKIGSVELESGENLPISWAQKRDVVMELLQSNNQQLVSLIAQPENLELLYEVLGVTELYIPGEDDRNKQYDEIKQLLDSEPIEQPPDPNAVMASLVDGAPEPPPVELPSVDVDPIIDNHEVEFEICRKWAISTAGQLAKTENPNGYKNVLLHAIMHKQLILSIPGEAGAAPLASPKQNKQAPITGDSNVSAQA